MPNPPRAAMLLRASHPEPTVAVTLLAALLGIAASLGAGAILLVATAVLTGQLTIGWTNDLVDAGRDAAVHRDDKPLATGALPVRTVQVATGIALLACIALSLLVGLRPGLVHLVLLVGSGWAYNLGLKRTVWSWLPYAVAFGALPSVVWLAQDRAEVAPVWMGVAGAALGVGAHLVNVLPDLADDAATGVRGMPQRLGRRGTQVAATAVLAGASAVVVLGPPGAPPAVAWAGLAVAAGLAAVALGPWDKGPFRAAIAIALLDVVLLLVMS